MTHRVLMLDNGGPSPAVARHWGRFGDWFAARLPAGIELQVHDPREPLPAPTALPWRGVILSGSTLGVEDGHAWARAEADWALQVARSRPVLAVCFGHQIVAAALGGQVGRIPRGPERGGITLQLTAAGRRDPLFAGMPDPIRVHSSHRDEVVRPPPGAVRLAGTQHSPWQAYAVGPLLRAVQFHPEFAPGPMGAILENYGLRGAERPPVWEEDHGRAILANWAHSWLGVPRAAAPVAGAG